MPAYQYTGHDARYYPSLGVHAKPADEQGPATVAEFDARPPAEDEPQLQHPEGARRAPDDGRWEPTKKKPTPPAATAAAADSPADDGQKAGE